MSSDEAEIGSASSPVHTWTAETELTIAEAANLHQRWLTGLLELEGVPVGAQLCLDMSQVQSCDSAGIQLLISLRHSVLAAGLQLVLSSPSAMLSSALRSYGLDAALSSLPADS